MPRRHSTKGRQRPNGRTLGKGTQRRSVERTTLKGVTVFLDRDGTLNHDSGYISSPDEFILFAGVVEAIARLNQAGGSVVLVTNQSGLARGLFTLPDLEAIHRKLEKTLKAGGAWLDGIFFCPHHPNEACWCRKPNPGLLEQAEAKLGVHVSRSYVVGDKIIDMKLARNVGAVGVLVTTSSYSRESQQAVHSGEIRPEFVVCNFEEAVNWILQDAEVREWTTEPGL